MTSTREASGSPVAGACVRVRLSGSFQATQIATRRASTAKTAKGSR